MPVAVQTVNAKPNRNVTFTFTDDVVAYVVGVAHWHFCFNKNDHHVRMLALSLANNKTGSREVTTTINATLQDDSGHDIDAEDSSVTLCCVAITRAQDSALVLASAANIPSGSASGSIALPSSSLSLSSAFLAGWSLTQGGDHHVKTFKTNAGFSQDGSVGKITSTAEMVDTSGNFAGGYIDGGLVAASASEFGIVAQALNNQQTSSPVPVNMGREIWAAAVMLQSLVVTFGSKDHHVKTIGGGCTGWKVNGSTVTLDNARAFISDDSGNNQSDAESHVSVVVFGIPL